MKTRPLTFAFLSTSLIAAVTLALYPLHAETKAHTSGKIEMSIPPNADMDQIEASIRQSAKVLNLDEVQTKQLDEEIQHLRENASKAKGKFDWKWEYNNDPAPPATRPQAGKSGGNKDQNQLRQQLRQQLDQERQQPQQRGGNGLNQQEFFRQFFGQDAPSNPRGNGGRGQNLDPQGFLQEMLRQLGGGLDPRQQGQNEAPQNRRRNSLEGLQGLFGGGNAREHEYDPNTAPRDSKYSRSTLSEYRSCIKDVRGSTVSVSKEGKPIALGAVVTADGYIITKASDLGKGNAECEFMDGRILTAKVVHKLEQYDLALLKVEAKDLKPIHFKDTDIAVGTMLVASGIDENPISVGVLSVPSRNLDQAQKGFVGVGLEDSSDNHGVKVAFIVPDGPGEAAGLEVNDVVLSIDGTVVDHRHDLMRIIAAKGPGESVKLSVKPQQGGDPVDVEVTLKSRADFKQVNNQGLDPTAQMGSDLTNRVANFPNALQNDLGLNAEQCGGPVVDIDGNVVGLNVARSGRTSTLMLSGKIMQGLLSEVTSGKLNLVKDSVTIDKDLKRAEAALKAAQAAVKEAQDAKSKLGQ